MAPVRDHPDDCLRIGAAYRSPKGSTGIPGFSKLEQGFPKGSAEEVKTIVGGRVDADWIKNTCAIRVSRSLNYSGRPIPGSKKTISGADGLWYFFRVVDLKEYLITNFGPPSLVLKRTAGKAIAKELIKNKKGIVHFDVPGWSDATGHFTLWDGTACGDKCYFEQASVVSFWEAP